ncbi:MAG: A/G-specific adenine glycosylase [Bacteroidetes bacterium]|nr:MAG: A/G-specific adenine glycosylase [Bacteroidota bacterium]
MAEDGAFTFFRESLMAWHFENPRPLPWKETDDPYKIWISEIILQQTRIIQGIPYYERFVKKYPTVCDLAKASEAEVLKDWQGLGYNSRARNLRKAAITVCEDHSGYFPGTYDDLITLSGIGPYTAAAIASFAFGERVPVIDANVIRILCRYLGIEEVPVGRNVRLQMESVLNDAMMGADPAEFNQAIMNFGALQCTPGKPDCAACPLSDTCYAYNTDRVGELPKTRKRKPRRERFFHYLVLKSDEGVMIHHRTKKDIWEGMYDFPLKELESALPLKLKQLNDWAVSLVNTEKYVLSDPVCDTQILTHQKISCVFYPCTVKSLPGSETPLLEKARTEEIFFVANRNLHKFAVPKIIDCYFRVKSILL